MVLDCRGLDRGIPILLSWLQREGIVKSEAVPAILDAMGERGTSVEDAVVRLANVSDEEIARRYAEYFHVPLAKPETVPEPTPDLAGLLPEAFCREHQLVPIARTPTGIVVAMVDPSWVWLTAQISMMTGLDLDVQVAPLSHVRAWILRLFAPSTAPAPEEPAS